MTEIQKSIIEHWTMPLISQIRTKLLEEIKILLPKENDYFYNISLGPNYAYGKYLFPNGKITCYQAYHNQLEADCIEDLPIENLVVLSEELENRFRK
jgi:hypothetical protein